MTPFQRTTCACERCVQCCKEQPGPLAPGEFEAIAEHLRLPPDEAKALFWASPGGVVGDRRTGRTYRVGTITPRRENGKCVFLDDNDRCRIHSVAPAGCAIFDTHMPVAEAQARAVWLIVEQARSTAYQALRATLTAATSYKPTSFNL